MAAGGAETRRHRRLGLALARKASEWVSGLRAFHEPSLGAPASRRPVLPTGAATRRQDAGAPSRAPRFMVPMHAEKNERMLSMNRRKLIRRGGAAPASRALRCRLPSSYAKLKIGAPAWHPQ